MKAKMKGRPQFNPVEIVLTITSEKEYVNLVKLLDSAERGNCACNDDYEDIYSELCATLHHAIGENK